MSYLVKSQLKTEQNNKKLLQHGYNSISCFVPMPHFIRKNKDDWKNEDNI